VVSISVSWSITNCDSVITTSTAQRQSSIASRTWDLRINSPSGASVISLHHQLLMASAQPRHRSRIHYNAGACKTPLAHFWAHLALLLLDALYRLRAYAFGLHAMCPSSDPNGATSDGQRNLASAPRRHQAACKARNAVSGSRSTMVSKTTAGPVGCRRCCSQF